MTVQFIEKKGKPEWAILPYKTYRRLLAKAEMLTDIQDYDAAKTALEIGDEESLPAELVFAILDGANPIKIWREYRGLTQDRLAQMAGISKPYLSQIETGKRTGSAAVLRALAEALNISMDDL